MTPRSAVERLRFRIRLNDLRGVAELRGPWGSAAMVGALALLLMVSAAWLIRGRSPGALLHEVLVSHTFLILAAVLLLESAVIGWNGSSLRRIVACPTRSTALDLTLFGLQFLGLMRYATLVFTLGLGYVSGVLSSRFVSLVTHHELQLRTGVLVGDLALYVLVASLVEYWNHRLLHTRYFWPLHRVHHSATELNGITSWRNHPALFAWEPFLRMWVTAFFWAPPGCVLILSAHQFLTHSRFPWSWGIVGRWIVVSPLNHRLHHSADPRHYGRNFSVYLVMWDRLFGTYGGDARTDEPLGLASDDQSFRGLVADMGHLMGSGGEVRGRRRRAGAVSAPGRPRWALYFGRLASAWAASRQHPTARDTSRRIP